MADPSFCNLGSTWFPRSLGITPTMSKLWVILKDGLTIAQQLGCSSIVVQLDVELIIYLLKSISINNSMMEPSSHLLQESLEALEDLSQLSY